MMPGDPQINEAGCIYMLQQEITFETLPYVQNAALQVVADLYDRKTTRDEFMKNVGTAISLYATLAKISIVRQSQALLADGPMDGEEVGKAGDHLTAVAAGKAAALVKVMRLLMECATSEDKVH
jgi:hypothetical protein